MNSARDKTVTVAVDSPSATEAAGSRKMVLIKVANEIRSRSKTRLARRRPLERCEFDPCGVLVVKQEMNEMMSTTIDAVIAAAEIAIAIEIVGPRKKTLNKVANEIKSKSNTRPMEMQLSDRCKELIAMVVSIAGSSRSIASFCPFRLLLGGPYGGIGLFLGVFWIRFGLCIFPDFSRCEELFEGGICFSSFDLVEVASGVELSFSRKLISDFPRFLICRQAESTVCAITGMRVVDADCEVVMEIGFVVRALHDVFSAA